MKAPDTLMLHWSPGPWGPFSCLGKAISCCQVDLGAVGSLNSYSGHPISYWSKDQVSGEAVTCCSRKDLTQSMPLSHQRLCPGQHHRATSWQLPHYGSLSDRGLLGAKRQISPVMLCREVGQMAQGLHLDWRGLVPLRRSNC